MTYASDLEIYMLELINAERTSRGLNPLRLETNLNEAAEDHSEWMLDANVFSHTGQGNSSATQRMIEAGFDLSGSWATAENIAIQSARGAEGYRDDVKNLHDSLMNSAGHRANILNPNLEYIGIGVEVGSFTYSNGFTGNSVIVTQNFGRTQGSIDLDDLRGDSGGIMPDPSDGPDLLRGSSGDDLIRGLDGADTIFGQSGHDTLFGGTQNDRLFGAKGRDKLDGGSGNDVVKGGAHKDVLRGSSGADTLYGGNGNDKLFGNAGKDTLHGENGNDTLKGGNGDDRLEGGAGTDRLFGGSGSDSFVFRKNWDEDQIADFSKANDRLLLDDNLWTGNRDAADVVNDFATVSNGDVVFDFGNGDTLVLEGVTSLSGLSELIDIV